MIDTSTIRGLEYYTGAVFEAQLTFPVQNEAGDRVFGSVAGGGRYDDLVARFTGQTVPATGVSIGVSRLKGLCFVAQRICRASAPGRGHRDGQSRTARSLPEWWRIASGRHPRRSLCRHRQIRRPDEICRQARRAIAVIEGGDESAKGEVTIKDLAWAPNWRNRWKAARSICRNKRRRSAPCRKTSLSMRSAKCWRGTGFKRSAHCCMNGVE